MFNGKNFEDRWEGALKKNRSGRNAVFLHTTDAVAQQGHFKGWHANDAHGLLADCAQILDDCKSIIDKERSIEIRELAFTHGLRLATVTVPLSDFERAVKRIPELVSPEMNCAVQCVAFCAHFCMAIGDKMSLIFDQGESFLGHIAHRMENRKSKRDNWLWANVFHCGAASSEDCYGLQAADLLAWSVNNRRIFGKDRYRWQSQVVKIERDRLLLNYPALMKADPESVAKVKAWKLPKRRAR